MSQEIIDAVRDIEREKGIESGTLVAALEDALLAAYKKMPGSSRHATVEIDQHGDFRVYSIELPPDIEERLIEEARERKLEELEALEAETGERSHTLISDDELDVDSVGACVGPRGSRVRMVVSELRGEKIDIIPWNPEPARFVAKALSPARVREVYLDDDAREATVVTPDDQLALAIGKEGMNARLAARLTGWKIDIQSDSEFAQAEAEAAFGGVYTCRSLACFERARSRAAFNRVLRQTVRVDPALARLYTDANG